jgi:hypothetical protein
MERSGNCCFNLSHGTADATSESQTLTLARSPLGGIAFDSTRYGPTQFLVNDKQLGIYLLHTQDGSCASDLEAAYACEVCGLRWEIRHESSGAARVRWS